MLEVKPKQTPEFSQPKTEKELLGKLDEVFHKRLGSMKEHYRQWQLNLAFERGRQWCTYDRLYGKIIDLRPRGANKSRVVFNLIGSFVRSTLSMLSQSHPTMDVVPASFSPQDEKVARSAQVHLERVDILNKKSVNDILIRKLMLTYGTAFKLIYWDSVPNMEDMNESPPGTIEELQEAGKPPEKIPLNDEKEEAKLKRLERGECGERIFSPFEILLDYPLVRQDADIRNFIRWGVVDLDYVKSSWKRGKYVREENTASESVLSEVLRSDMDLFEEGRAENQVILKEYYEAPTDVHPRGRMIQWANGVLLHDGVLSHPKGKLGILPYHWEVDPNDFYGASYVQPLIEPQVIVNRLLSKMTDWLGKSVRFRVGVPRNAQFSRSKALSADDGDVFEYNNIGGTGVVNLPIPELPSGIFNFLDATISNFRDLASRHEVSKGTVPGRVESGRAIRSLQEADSSYLITAMIIWEEREREAAHLKLDLMREYYNKPRQAKIIGEMRKVEMFDLKGADLSAGIDIHITRGSAMPRSRTAQNSYITELYTLGLLGNTENPEVHKKVMRLLDIGGVQGMYGEGEIGSNLQQQEIADFRDGTYHPAETFNDHYMHSRECLKVLNSPDFFDEEPEFRDMLIRHWQEHVEFLKSMNMGMDIPPPKPEAPPPTPGAGGQAGLPEAMNPQAQEMAM